MQAQILTNRASLCWLVILLVVSWSGCKDGGPSAPPAPTRPATGPANNKYVTKEYFAKIKPGMDYDELQEMFGDMGTVTGRFGDPTVDEDFPVINEGQRVVKWVNGDAWIKVLLDRNKVAAKRAKGLN